MRYSGGAVSSCRNRSGSQKQYVPAGENSAAGRVGDGVADINTAGHPTARQSRPQAGFSKISADSADRGSNLPCSFCNKE